MGATLVSPPKGMRWVSCAREIEWSTARHKHLTRQSPGAHWVDTLCGATGVAGALHGRATRNKPQCPDCVERTVRP